MSIALDVKKAFNNYVHQVLRWDLKSVDVSTKQVSQYEKIIFWFFKLFCIILANTTVFPAGSRCALKPCENNGLCFDLSSADAYHCACHDPYTGVHCQVQERIFPPFICGNITSEITPYDVGFTSDKALPYICVCLRKDVQYLVFALNNCHNGKLFHKVCDGKEPFVGSVPFTNKAFYICKPDLTQVDVQSCDLHHVWNDTQKECVPE